MTSTQSGFESHFVCLKDSLYTGFLGPASDNPHGRLMSSYGTATLFHQAKEASLRGSYFLPFPNPSCAKMCLHYRRLRGHIFTLYMKRPNLLKLTCSNNLSL